MALAVRQVLASVRSSATSIGRTYASAVLAGSLLIAHGAWWGASSAASAAFSDNVNGAWGSAASTGYTLEGTGTGGDGWIECCAFPNSAAGTITVTMNPPTGSSDNDLTLLEVTGALTASPRDVSLTQAGTFTDTAGLTTTVTTGTLAQAAELVVFSFTHSASDRALTTDTGDGFTLADENESNSNGQCFNVGTKLTAATTSLVCQGTGGAGGVGSTFAWWSGVASFKEAAGVPDLPFLWPQHGMSQAVHRAAYW